MEQTPGRAQVRVEPVPEWIDLERWLGPLGWSRVAGTDGGWAAEASTTWDAAALVAAQLRGLGVDGMALRVTVTPPLSRGAVRAARLTEARARRAVTPGFTRPAARASGEGKYSLTPESLAQRMAAAAKGRSVVDACCGSGGNAVAFARAGCTVTAIDVDSARLAEARHNAGVYGVAGRIRFLQADTQEILDDLSAELLFIDPPWGQSYDKRRTTLADLPLLRALLESSSVRTGRWPEIWIKVPASFATAEVGGAVPRAWFGEAGGDRRRIKFLQLTLRGAGGV